MQDPDNRMINCYYITNPTEIQERSGGEFHLSKHIFFKILQKFLVNLQVEKNNSFNKKYTRYQYKDRTRNFSEITLTETC